MLVRKPARVAPVLYSKVVMLTVSTIDVTYYAVVFHRVIYSNNKKEGSDEPTLTLHAAIRLRIDYSME
jgi:hypothetical protein